MNLRKIMRPICLFIFFGFIALNGCTDRDTVFEEYQELNHELFWARNDVHSFAIPIRDNSRPLEQVLAFRCSASFPYSNMLFRITETSPDGKTLIRDVDLPVRNTQGKVSGDISGDLADLTYTFDTSRKFPVLGTYHYTVQHTMPMDTVHLALEIGLLVRRIKDEY